MSQDFAFDPDLIANVQDGPLGRRASQIIGRLIGTLAYGRLRIVTPYGVSFTQTGEAPGPEATIVLRNWRALRRVVSRGDIGFAEGFIEGDWTSPDRVEVLRLFVRNAEHMRSTITGSRFSRVFSRIKHWMRGNSKRGSRRNIEAHYDLGNDFYRQWLDEAMIYSSAIFVRAGQSLEDAQQEKLRRIRELLELEGGESILEIGFGWGALAKHLSKAANARVTGITLSPSQLAYAQATLDDRQVAERVALKLQDYREVRGKFDRVVSIEMFEAVGEAYWPSYFATIRRSLAEGGRAVLQVISIAELNYDQYRRDTDFIQAYIFPGGFLPSKTTFAQAVAKAGLAIVKAEHFGLSYAETLAEWRRRFNHNWPKIALLGFDDRFRRLWNYYLEYCEAGFREGAIDVGLYTLASVETPR